MDGSLRQPPRWGWSLLAGRLVEISGGENTASLSIVASLIREVQSTGESAAWIGWQRTCFYPPDFIDAGIDLETLPIIRLAMASDIPTATEHLLRSGAFALLVLDVVHGAASRDFSLAVQTRLAGLAKHHDTAVICLTEKERSHDRTPPSLGPMLSLHVEAERRALVESTSGATDDDSAIDRRSVDRRFWICHVHVLKDKRHMFPAIHEAKHGAHVPQHSEWRCGPAGLR